MLYVNYTPIWLLIKNNKFFKKKGRRKWPLSSSHPLMLHSLATDEHLGCFQLIFISITNKDSINIYVQFFF